MGKKQSAKCHWWAAADIVFLVKIEMVDGGHRVAVGALKTVGFWQRWENESATAITYAQAIECCQHTAMKTEPAGSFSLALELRVRLDGDNPLDHALIAALRGRT